jgi:hypothetical protein
MVNSKLDNLNKRADQGFIRNLIINNDSPFVSSRGVVSSILAKVRDKQASLQVIDSVWYFPFQFNPSGFPYDTDTMGFSMMCRFKYSTDITVSAQGSTGKEIEIEKDTPFFAIISGVVKFSELTDTRINVLEVPMGIQLKAIYFNKIEKTVKSEWDYLTGKIGASIAFETQEEKTEFLTEKIEAYNDLDKMGLLGEEEFADRLKFIIDIAGHKETKVWGEYNQVANLTKQQVLMNKATAISLTKTQVIGLVDQLSKIYSKQLHAINRPIIKAHLSRTGGKVPVVFSVEMRGHADPSKFRISLPKLGDWRMGFNGTYSAEVVFHEFAHVVDFGRKSGRGNTSRSDVHKHDFVEVLDNMLLKFEDWINKKYSSESHQNQIVGFADKQSYFYDNKRSIVSEIAKEEKQEREQRSSQESDALLEAGISENEFPLHLILDGDRTLKTDYLAWAATEHQKNPTTQGEKAILAKLKGTVKKDGDIQLDKDQMTQLSRAVDSAKRTKFIFNLPMNQQIKSMDALKEFETQISDLNRGKLASAKPVESNVTIEQFDDYMITPDTTEQNIILGLS